MKPSRKPVATKPASKPAEKPTDAQAAKADKAKKQLIYYGVLTAVIAACVIPLVVVSGQYASANKKASNKLHGDIRTLVENFPKLKPMYKEAMSDKKLTVTEAKEIADKAKKLNKK